MSNKMYRQPSRTEIARLADCDERTVTAFLAGEPTRPRIAARISRAIDWLASEMAADREANEPPRPLSLCSVPRRMA